MEKGFIILFGLTMLYLATTSRLVSHIRLLIAQGILLFLMCCTSFFHVEFLSFDYAHLTHSQLLAVLNFAFLTVETLIVKAAVIPWFLQKVAKKTNSNRDYAPNVPHFYCLVIASVILLLGFLASNYWVSSVKMLSPIHFGVSLATIVISLWLITIKHHIISNVIGFITMENGIFLLSLSVAKEMPILVNMGVLLDVFIAVYILGLFVNVINTEFKDMEISHLSDLKDYE